MRGLLIGISLLGVLLLSYWYVPFLSQEKEVVYQFPETAPEAPLGLPPIPWPKDNPYSAKKAELGRVLYFDTRLSSDETISCAHCHAKNEAFTDNLSISFGIDGRRGTRNSPTVINAAYLKRLFWDGRAKSLEEQATGPIGNTHEMTLIESIHEAHQECVEQVKAIPGYRKLFKEAYGDEELTIERIAQAIATFERTIVSGNSPYDRYMAGDKTALTEEQVRGLRLMKTAGCLNCHGGPLFSDERFLNIGVGMDAKEPDLGRYGVTHKDKDWGAFKVPTLRDVEQTYPYMHDGSLLTLEEVIDYYDKGGIPNKNLHPLMKPLNLSEADKKALVSFLKSLNGEGWQHYGPPEEFPK